MMLILLDEAGCPVARRARPWDRILARVRACRLDRDLAAGASPDATLGLALRAQALVRARARRDLAHGAQRLLAAALQPPAPGGLPLPAAGRSRITICRDRVKDSSPELADLIGRLLDGGPVTARGVALAAVLLSDGSGPLYRRATPDDLRARVREALNALSPAGA